MPGWRRLRDDSQLRQGGHPYRGSCGPAPGRGWSSFVKSWTVLMARIDSKRPTPIHGWLTAAHAPHHPSAKEQSTSVQSFGSTPFLGGAEEASSEDQAHAPQQLFAKDPARGEKLMLDGLFQEPDLTDETLGSRGNWPEFGLREHIDACSAVTRSTPRRSAPCCTWPARAARRFHPAPCFGTC